VASARQALDAGRAVLIATESVAESDYLTEQLTRDGLHPTLLNARNDGAEATVVALAGQPGRLTVSTNMAGRGTDIQLDPAVAARGGLHVINCQLNGSRRIDRQLEGRCARQGDPGSAETLLRLDSPLMTRNLPSVVLRWAAHLIRPESGALAHWPGRALASLAQRLETARQQSQRALLLAHDTRMDRQGLFRE
jgi:preprotein translocase subunit SecA